VRLTIFLKLSNHSSLVDEIIAYFDNRTTNGVVEGINNKLKLIKRSAYGFRNFDNFRLDVYFVGILNFSLA